MDKIKEKENLKSKPVYEKPLFQKEEDMTFPVDIINSLGHSIRCTQCSSCHGCA